MTPRWRRRPCARCRACRGAGGPDLAREDLPVVGVGVPAQQLGRAERRALARDRDVTQHRDHHPAALADAVDRAHDRLARAAHGVERREIHAEPPRDVAPRVGAGAAEVAAGDEDVVDAGDEQAGQLG